MAIKNTILGGTNWIDGEVLYSVDLNDTVNATADLSVINPFAWNAPAGDYTDQYVVGGRLQTSPSGVSNFNTSTAGGEISWRSTTGDVYVESDQNDVGNPSETPYTKVISQFGYTIMTDISIVDSVNNGTSYDTTKNYYQKELTAIIKYYEDRSAGGTYGATYTGLYITDGTTWSDRLLASDGSSCFLGKQLLTYADGTQKPIEEVKKGDTVLAWNEEDNSFKPSIVNEIQIKNHSNLYELHLEDGKILYPTANHPFWIKGKKWATASGLDELEIGAGKLLEGDYVYTTSKEWVKIEKIIGIDGEFKTYNLLDMDYGTFVVDNIVVHNSGNNYVSGKLVFNGDSDTVDVYRNFASSPTTIDLSGLTSNWYFGVKSSYANITTHLSSVWDDEAATSSTVQEKIATKATIGGAYQTANNITSGELSPITNPGLQGKFLATFTMVGSEILIVKPYGRLMAFKMFA